MSPADGAAPLPPLAAEDHVCPGCDMAYADLDRDRATALVETVAERIAAAARTVPERHRGERPAPDTWSVVEYVCHVRDVYATYALRVHRTRTETRPVLEPMLNDLRARRFRYNDRPLEPVLDELAVNALGFLDEVHLLDNADLLRTATRLPGESRTALWLVRQATHEGIHHLQDIRWVARKVSRGP